MIRSRWVVPSCLAAIACSPAAEQDLAGGRRTMPSPTESTADASTPSLSEIDGRVVIVWTETKPTKRVRWSTLAGERWGTPRTVVEDDALLTNWADFAELHPLADGSMLTHWMVRTSDEAFAYDAYVGAAKDGAHVELGRLHEDRVSTEHGFVSFAARTSGGGTFVWLDGRAMGGGESEGAMRLYARDLGSDGKLGGEVVVDERVCSCCQTDAIGIGDDVVVAYRDRSDAEVRDIAVARRRGDEWGTRQIVGSDDWTIEGCPVNGPNLTRVDERWAVAWFTGEPVPGKVQVAWEGGNAIRVDSGHPLGRVDLETVDGERVVATWVEVQGELGYVVARTVTSDGVVGAPHRLGRIDVGRGSGFPSVVSTPEALYAAWTDPNETGGSLQVVSLPIDAL